MIEIEKSDDVVYGYALGYNDGLEQSGGNTDDWNFPEDWIDIPDPEPNQIVMLMDVRLGNGKSTIFGCYNDVGKYGGCTIDCGDGQIIQIPEGTGVNFQHYYTEQKQYIMTITSDYIDAIDFYTINYTDETSPNSLRAIKVGANMHLRSNRLESSLKGLVYTEFFGEAVNCYRGLVNLECIKAHVPPVEIKQQCFDSCYNLRYIYDFLNNITMIPINCFVNCPLVEIHLPNATMVENKTYTHISSCYNLKIFNAPKLTQISPNDFRTCVHLEKLIVADGCNYNGNTFSDCFLLTSKS